MSPVPNTLPSPLPSAEQISQFFFWYFSRLVGHQWLLSGPQSSSIITSGLDLAFLTHKETGVWGTKFLRSPQEACISLFPNLISAFSCSRHRHQYTLINSHKCTHMHTHFHKDTVENPEGSASSPASSTYRSILPIYSPRDTNSSWLNFLPSREEKPTDKSFIWCSNLVSRNDIFMVNKIT